VGDSALLAHDLALPGHLIAGGKRLSPRARERLAQEILVLADAVSVVSVSASEIDRRGIDPANESCLTGALRGLGDRADVRLVDGDDRRPLRADAPPHRRIVRGDGTSTTVAAASIVAKVARDQVMAGLGARYPAYGFETHKGYGTPQHMRAIEQHGRIPDQHRFRFEIRGLDDAGADPS
jgi:ribonuclease HII